MSEVEAVALWVGLLAGVTSIVLALVAIWFSREAEKKSGELIEQSIKSLQKIETTVEQVSSDTRELIKAGWDRMLANVAGPSSLDFVAETDGNQEIARGIADEVASEVADEDSDGAADLSDIRDRLSKTLATLANIRSAQGEAEAVDYAIEALRRASPRAYALASVLREGSRHLSREEYVRLVSHDPLASLAVDELRQAGVLVPLRGEGSEDERVYWFPPGMAGPFQAAISLIGAPDDDTHLWAHGALEQAGWDSRYHA